MQLVNALNTILGPQQFNVLLNNIKAADAQRSEVIIHAYERGRGRLGAMQLYRYLTMSDKMRALESQLMCQKVVPVVALSAVDKAKFLNTTPATFHPALWRQYVRANPDPALFLPQPIYGYEQLAERARMQHTSDKVQRTIIDQNVERLKRVQSELADVRAHLQSSKRSQKEYSYRCVNSFQFYLWQISTRFQVAKNSRSHVYANASRLCAQSRRRYDARASGARIRPIIGATRNQGALFMLSECEYSLFVLFLGSHQCVA